MAGILDFITEADERALFSTARRLRFDEGQTILAEGERRKALFVLRSGQAAVERSHGDFNVEISELAPGEVFGEMGFVEDFPASASVVARGRCEVDVIEESDIRGLMLQDPLFSGRFFQSIAFILSRRLRATTVDALSEFSWGTGFPAVSASEEESDRLAGWGGGSPLRAKEE
jgi:CRP-like cAMP-binding protein